MSINRIDQRNSAYSGGDRRNLGVRFSYKGYTSTPVSIYNSGGYYGVVNFRGKHLTFHADKLDDLKAAMVEVIELAAFELDEQVVR